MRTTFDLTIQTLAPQACVGALEALAQLLHACVHDGASIGFVLPFSVEQAASFWRDRVAPALAEGGLDLLVVLDGDRIVATAQLAFNMPANQPHRAEVRKLMVHPAYRRRGIAQALMSEIELRAKTLRRTLLTLDTRSGDAAERLYAGLGYQSAGVIPGYCVDAQTGRLDSTTIMYKVLHGPGALSSGTAGGNS